MRHARRSVALGPLPPVWGPGGYPNGLRPRFPEPFPKHDFCVYECGSEGVSP